MAGITIGLDFGTHQTKVCVEDRSDKRNPVYSFIKFRDLEGVDHLVLPSVVQINEDDTLSYGFVDEKRVKYIAKKHTSKPVPPEKLKDLVLPSEPKLKIIKEKKINDSSSLGNVIEKKNEQNREQQKYRSQLSKWKVDCIRLKTAYEQQQIVYQKKYEYYQLLLEKWESDMRIDKQPLILRYFKQVCFSQYEWKYDIPVELVSIWYLSFILFDIEKQYGTDFQVKMGISAGMTDLNIKKKRAVSLMLSAYHLVEEVFNNNKDEFLRCKITDLIECTQILPYSLEKKEEYSIFVFPEAYANLRPIAKRNKVTDGLNLLVDIGGGTTDITFFSIDKNSTPYISDFISLPYGLNYIIENSTIEQVVAYKADLDTININPYLYKEAYAFYYSKIKDYHKRLVYRIVSEIYNIVPEGEIYKIIHNRPIIYAGGGSTYEKICEGVGGFDDVKYISQMFDSHYIIEDRDQVELYYSILSTALGLTLCGDSDNIKLYNLSLLFKNVKQAFRQSDKSKKKKKCNYALFVD